MEFTTRDEAFGSARIGTNIVVGFDAYDHQIQ
jgi:hypothetical protein